MLPQWYAIAQWNYQCTYSDLQINSLILHSTIMDFTKANTIGMTFNNSGWNCNSELVELSFLQRCLSSCVNCMLIIWLILQRKGVQKGVQACWICIISCKYFASACINICCFGVNEILTQLFKSNPYLLVNK